MNRNASLDIARLIGAFGIVLFHAGASGRSIGYAALPFFLMALIVLGFPSASNRPFGAYARERAARLLRPWLIWSAIYGLFKLAEVILGHKPMGSEFSASMVLTGPALHLWFLPFAFAACLALPALQRGFALLPPLAGLALCLGLTLVSLWPEQMDALPAPLAQWSFGLPALLLGLGIALAQTQPRGREWSAFGLLALLGLAMTIGWQVGLLQLGLGGAALLACLAWPGRETTFSRFCARISLNVYLVHPLILSVLERLTPLPHGNLGLALLTMLAALLFAALLDRVTWGTPSRANPSPTHLPEGARHPIAKG